EQTQVRLCPQYASQTETRLRLPRPLWLPAPMPGKGGKLYHLSKTASRHASAEDHSHCHSRGTEAPCNGSGAMSVAWIVLPCGTSAPVQCQLFLVRAHYRKRANYRPKNGSGGACRLCLLETECSRAWLHPRRFEVRGNQSFLRLLP